MAGYLRTLGAAALAALATGTLGSAQALAASPRLMVFYVEASPAKAASVAKALETFASNAREAEGADAPIIEILREAGRPNRMAVVEQWRNLAADKADRRTKALAAAVGADLEAPIDDRLGDPLVPLNFTTAPTGVFHVLTHIDVASDGADSASKAITGQKTSMMAAPGALAFEAAAQTGHANSFAVHEVWRSRADYEAYAASPAGIELRRQFAQSKGAPFDDRFYDR